MSKRYLVISDLHIGVQRVAGTTTTSADALRAWLHGKHKDLLDLAGGTDTVIVNGDLTDTFNIDLGQAIEVYAVAAEWLQKNPKANLVWATGNHDLSKDSSKLGTVAFIGRLLEGQFPGRFTLITAPQSLAGTDIYILPHVANQDIFDLELTRIPEDCKYVLLHCNMDNVFACNSDHSLNISREQAKKLTKAGKILILGHEHQGRTLLGDKVIVVGNQIPSSVSDCLKHGDGQADGCKYALVIEGGDLELVPTWSPKDPTGWFQEIDWTQLDKVKPGQGFVRVTGTAEASEAANVIKVISSLRQSHGAFVITNAVKVAGLEGADEIDASIEQISSVNVLEILLSMLEPDQQAAVRKLMENQE